MFNVLKALCATAIMLCMAMFSVAQTKDANSPLRILVDYARFRGDENNVYVEVYYAFPQRSLTYTPDAAGFKAGVELTVTVATKDSMYFAERLMVPHIAKDTSVSTMNLISSSNMMLKEGEYTLKVVGKDVNNASRRDSVLMRLPVKLPPTDRFVLSDIEFASNIKKGKQGSPFYKNTLEVIPNVDGVYSDEQRCFYYAEAYNLLVGDDKNDFILKSAIYNAIGKEIISRERPRKRSGESTVLVDNFDVANVRSGTYTLVLSLQDSSKKTISSSGKKFFVYNAVLGVDSSLLKLDPAISMSVYSTMEEPELDREFKWTKWEAQETEKDQYAGLQGVTAKRKFLTEFWSKRPLGLREQYLQRVAHANSAYNVLGREGYRTDRGRVHIVYGSPDDIDRHPNEAGTRPYEIWSFNNIQGGVIFVFVLRQNGGDYELVHSTHRNELHDENWSRYAQTN